MYRIIDLDGAGLKKNRIYKSRQEILQELDDFFEGEFDKKALGKMTSHERLDFYCEMANLEIEEVREQK
jgi:hypothetical protein